MSNFKFYTVHKGRNSMNTPSTYLQLGKHDYFSNPTKYPTESYVLPISDLPKDVTIEDLKEEKYFHL